MLDVQPGRVPFLTEAEAFEDLLREPEVSLALDPEWRMGPDEVPGEVIGSADAREVNRVSAWRSALVRRERLPEKLLIVHPFGEAVIARREALRTRPGVALVLNADGVGEAGAYGLVTAGRSPTARGSSASSRRTRGS